jgi:hypothetical protein
MRRSLDVAQTPLKPEIPAPRATDNARRKAATVAKRFCILRRAILRERPNEVTPPFAQRVQRSEMFVSMPQKVGSRRHWTKVQYPYSRLSSMLSLE